MTLETMTADDFAELIDVSRETLQRLERYIDLLKHWQRAINLVGSDTLKDPWRRHVLDSAQLINHLPASPGMVLDLGSGAGLPGLILGILGVPNIHLVESDQRKAQFLKEASRRLEVNVTVHAHRIEDLESIQPAVVTARALAPLPRLLDLASPFLNRKTICLFLKGKHGKDELTIARKSWMMRHQLFPSLSDPMASVLKLREIERAPLHRQ